MSVSSLFAKIRNALVSVGRSERAAGRTARLIEGASFANFVRLTPEQNVKLGLSRKARHYVLTGRQARDQGDAYDQRSPLRDEEGA
jgi:hypothetical protein